MSLSSNKPYFPQFQKPTVKFLSAVLIQGTHQYVKVSRSMHTFFYKKRTYKKPVLGQPNRQETFSTQATEVKKLMIIFSSSCHNFEDAVTKFDKDMFRKASFCGTNSYS